MKRRTKPTRSKTPYLDAAMLIAGGQAWYSCIALDLLHPRTPWGYSKPVRQYIATFAPHGVETMRAVGWWNSSWWNDRGVDWTVRRRDARIFALLLAHEMSKCNALAGE